MPGSAMGVLGGVITGLPIAAESTSPLLTLIVALIGGGVVSAVYTAWQRSRSGEGPASAADDLGQAAAQIGGAFNDLLRPMRQANADLAGQVADLQGAMADRTRENAELTMKLADAQAEAARVRAKGAVERHDQAEQIAILKAQNARLELHNAEREAEMATYRVRTGDAPDRRHGDPD